MSSLSPLISQLNISYQFFIAILCSFCVLHISPFRMTNVVEVRVGLHCEECIKKILKAIKKIEDIETYNVDKQLNKVIVTGNVTTEEVIGVLQKIHKNAIPWEQPQTNC